LFYGYGTMQNLARYIYCSRKIAIANSKMYFNCKQRILYANATQKQLKLDQQIFAKCVWHYKGKNERYSQEILTV
jgi:hypothetical protein